MLGIMFIQPNLRLNYIAHPVGYVFPVGGAIALIVTLVLQRRQRDVAAFMTSSLFIIAMLGSLAWGCYPNILIATTDLENSLTIYNAATNTYGLQVGAQWFVIGFVLIIAYQVYVHRTFGERSLPTEQQHLTETRKRHRAARTGGRESFVFSEPFRGAWGASDSSPPLTAHANR